MREKLTAEELHALLGHSLPEGLGVCGNLDVILDVPVSLAVQAGRGQTSIRNLVNLSEGTVMGLDGALAEPLRLYANGRLIAHCELVVQGAQPAIRITQLLNSDMAFGEHAAGHKPLAKS